MDTPRAIPQPEAAPHPRGRQLAHMSLLALGVVYGDIGTSPLYALRECFHGSHAVAPTHNNVLGVLSLIFWSLMVIISLKYLVFVLRADNRGEGGILALMTLVNPIATQFGRAGHWLLVMMGIFGAALLYSDGMITPAISVLSAVEGLEVATHLFSPYVLPITVAVLVGLFMLQRHGTGVIGIVFGPIMVTWFLTLAVLGVIAIAGRPQVLAALNPLHAAAFFADNGWTGYLVLGAVFLVVTGGEALYADMGHLGARPIRVAWFTLVLPALLLNYFGQGALLLQDPEVLHPFYGLVPPGGVIPLVALATMATVIASQAVISGVFSLTMQAVQLGYVPRINIDHTSETHFGQIFIPPINWMLMLATIGLVLGFKESGNLAAAYGVAVNLDMLIVTLLLSVLAWRVWRWNGLLVAAMGGLLLAIELAFFGANIIKIAQGGWFPLVVAAGLFTIATTWKRGRKIVGERVRGGLMPMEAFCENMRKYPPHRVEGTAVFLSGNPTSVPLALVHNLKHNKVLHRRVVFLTITHEQVPRVPDADRITVRELGEGFHQIIARHGFMEEPHVPHLLEACAGHGIRFQLQDTTFFLGRESLLAAGKPGMALWRERLFAALSRNAQPATAYFQIPPNRVVEVGAQIEL